MIRKILMRLMPHLRKFLRQYGYVILNVGGGAPDAAAQGVQDIASANPPGGQPSAPGGGKAPAPLKDVVNNANVPGGHASHHRPSLKSGIPGAHVLAFVLILAWAIPANGQGGGSQSSGPRTSNAAPSGGCGSQELHVNNSNGDFYNCKSGVWFKVNGAGGSSFYQTVQQAGSSQTQESILNFLNGTNITITCADNPGNTSTDCTFTAAGGTGTPCTTTALSIQFNSAGSFGCLAEFTYAASTITASSSGKMDLSAISTTGGFKLPSAAGAIPTADSFPAFNTTNHTLVWGSNGVTIVGAAAATGTGTATTCSNQFVRAISSLVAPTCSTVALASDVSGQLPIGNVGSAGLSATAPIRIAATGVIDCAGAAACVTSAAALTNNQLVFGAGSQATAVGDLTGDATTSGGKTTTVVQVEGAAIPISAAVLGTNGSKQLIAATPHQVVTPILCTDTSASATTYTCTTTPSIGALTTGDTFIFTAINQSNSGSSTLNVDGIGAKTIKKWQNAANLIAGDLQTSGAALVTYDGTNFDLTTVGNTPTTGTVTNVATSSPITGGAITSTGTIACATCVTSAGSLTANLPVIGAGGQASAVGTRTGNTTQFASWTGATTAAKCVDTDGSGNLQVTAADCGGGTSSNPAVSNITPATVNANTTGDQQAQELSLSAAYLNTATQPFLFHGSGIFSTTLVPSVTVKFKLCSVSGCGSGTVVTLATMTTANTTSATNNQIIADMSCATHAIGATGNLICHGILASDLTASSVLTTTYSDANTAVSSNFDLTAAWFVDTSIAFSTGSASNSFTEQEMWLAPLATPTATSIACSGVTNGVCNNATNTGTAAMTLDMSASTTANSFKVPIGAGLTSGADGAVAYDTTGKLTHVRTNGADSSVVAATGTSTTTTQVLHATAVAGIGAFSAIATGDLPALSTTVNGQTCTIGSTCAVESATSGQVAISGGSGAALTGAADLTYSTHTFSGISTTIFDLSAATGTAALKVPSTTTNTATAAAVIDYDTTNSNYHANSGADSLIGVVPTASVPATGDIIDASVASSKFLLHDSGVATANVVTAASNGTTKQICTVASSNKACTWIDFPDVKVIPAANCNNTTAGAGWSIGSGGTVTCRAGTNNLGGYIAITDTSSTFATFQVEIPEDWDSASNPYMRFLVASTDATNGHTIIPSIQCACYKGDGTTTDDVAANAAHSLSTTTLNGNANRFWSGSNVQLNSTDVTGCVAGAMMQVTVGRATDTATNAEFYQAVMTFPRLLVVQAN